MILLALTSTCRKHNFSAGSALNSSASFEAIAEMPQPGTAKKEDDAASHGPLGWVITVAELALEATAYAITRTCRLIRYRQAKACSHGTANLAALPLELFEDILRQVRRDAIEHARTRFPFVGPSACVCDTLEARRLSQLEQNFYESRAPSDPLEDLVDTNRAAQLLYDYLSDTGEEASRGCMFRYMDLPLRDGGVERQCVRGYEEYWWTVSTLNEAVWEQYMVSNPKRSWRQNSSLSIVSSPF